MDTFDAIKERRSVKQYDATHQMTTEEVEKLFTMATHSPTAFNIQHWRFVNVVDKELREKIKAVSWNQAQVTDASMLVILTADTKAWDKEAIRYWKNADEPVQQFMVPAIEQYYSNNEQTQRDEAFRSCGIAAQTLMLTAKAMGYDSCPMDGFDFDAVGKLINLPEDHIISMFVVIGKGVKEGWPNPGKLSLSEVVVENKF